MLRYFGCSTTPYLIAFILGNKILMQGRFCSTPHLHSMYPDSVGLGGRERTLEIICRFCFKASVTCTEPEILVWHEDWRVLCLLVASLKLCVESVRGRLSLYSDLHATLSQGVLDHRWFSSTDMLFAGFLPCAITLDCSEIKT